MSLKDKLNPDRMPKHIAVVMDGNGRWAKKLGAQRIFGHKNGVKAVREVTEAAAELGIPYLTLYAFSTENWNRPKFEVDTLMSLLVSTITSEIPSLLKNSIRLQVIGDLSKVPEGVIKKLNEAIFQTKDCTRLTVILALSYSSRWEITEAARQMALDAQSGKLDPATITENTVSNYLATRNFPDPELMIRTSGELRISNFLMWQLSYAELYFTPTLWPDFRKEHFYEALIDYQGRERRFGKISEQIIEEED